MPTVPGLPPLTSTRTWARSWIRTSTRCAVGGLVLGASACAPDSAPEPVRFELRDAFAANVHHPGDGARYATVVVLGGSGGGIDWQEQLAARLSADGYAAVGLAYFGLDGLPDELDGIPLEYFERALEWTREQPFVDPDRIGIVGVSKGGELALLLAARHPEIKAVAAFVPSGVVWQSIADGFPDTSSWTVGGRPVPYVAYGAVEEPRGIIDFYVAGLEQADPETLEAATIPVERINGPVLLLSGEADNLWPSSRLAEMVVSRLERAGFDHPVEHVAYPDAGHLISSIRDEDVSRRGGTDEGNRRAQVDAQRRLLAFLDEALR